MPLKGAIALKKKTIYGIRAMISGANSQSGLNCISSVDCSVVTFTFFNSKHLGSKTDVKGGQFPVLLFSL